ncbi:unnamed protein product, partial [marine sediment metagenome]
RSLSMGDIRMLIEHQGELAVVVLFTGFEAQELRDDISKLTKKLHLDYGPIIANWSGALAEVQGIETVINEFLGIVPEKPGPEPILYEP